VELMKSVVGSHGSSLPAICENGDGLIPTLWLILIRLFIMTPSHCHVSLELFVEIFLSANFIDMNVEWCDSLSESIRVSFILLRLFCKFHRCACGVMWLSVWEY
jgi:hypothetical protein